MTKMYTPCGLPLSNGLKKGQGLRNRTVLGFPGPLYFPFSFCCLFASRSGFFSFVVPIAGPRDNDFMIHPLAITTSQGEGGWVGSHTKVTGEIFTPSGS